LQNLFKFAECRYN